MAPHHVRRRCPGTQSPGDPASRVLAPRGRRASPVPPHGCSRLCGSGSQTLLRTRHAGALPLVSGPKATLGAGRRSRGGGAPEAAFPSSTPPSRRHGPRGPRPRGCALLRLGGWGAVQEGWAQSRPRRVLPSRTCCPRSDLFWVPSPSGPRAAGRNAGLMGKVTAGGGGGHHPERAAPIFLQISIISWSVREGQGRRRRAS